MITSDMVMVCCVHMVTTTTAYGQPAIQRQLIIVFVSAFMLKRTSNTVQYKSTHSIEI